MLVRIFLAVGRADMRRIVIEVGASDAVVLAVGVHPFPERLRRRQALRAGGAIDADDIGGKSVAIAAAKTAAVIGAVAGGLEARCDRLAIVVAESAGDAGILTGLFGGEQ